METFSSGEEVTMFICPGCKLTRSYDGDRLFCGVCLGGYTPLDDDQREAIELLGRCGFKLRLRLLGSDLVQYENEDGEIEGRPVHGGPLASILQNTVLETSGFPNRPANWMERIHALRIAKLIGHHTVAITSRDEDESYAVLSPNRRRRGALDPSRSYKAGPTMLRACRECAHPVDGGPTLCDGCANVHSMLDVSARIGPDGRMMEVSQEEIAERASYAEYMAGKLMSAHVELEKEMRRRS